jgi:hypothetical protein
VEQSRRWRIATSKLLNKMTPEEQIAFLNRRIAHWSAAPATKPVRRKPALAHR